jgi:hypothetical protein
VSLLKIHNITKLAINGVASQLRTTLNRQRIHINRPAHQAFEFPLLARFKQHRLLSRQKFLQGGTRRAFGKGPGAFDVGDALDRCNNAQLFSRKGSCFAVIKGTAAKVIFVHFFNIIDENCKNAGGNG